MRAEVLRDITATGMEVSPFPLREILEDSLFYPASGTDGTPIRHWLPGILSFVYVDTSTSKDAYDTVLSERPPKGYSVLASKNLTPRDLAPNGWAPIPPQGIDRNQYIRTMQQEGASPSTSFATWTVFERDSELNEEHGPVRFSLLFLRAEGAAAYQAMYVSNQARPKAVAILRPGTSFGGNFSNFEEVLLKIMQANPAGMPEFLMQWHHTRENGSHPAPPWNDIYGQRTIGGLNKDNDPGFVASVYPIKIKN